MNRKNLDGGIGVLTVTPYNASEKRDVGVPRPFTNLYVKNFPTIGFSEADLYVTISLSSNLQIVKI